MIHFIVPPATSGGVYDFACKLQGAIGRDQVRLVHLAKEDAASWAVNEGDTVILQMSGYGFQKRATPLWLLRELEARRPRIKTLGIFFHELYAFGPPWSSSFWLSPVQRYIARRLAEMADFWITSREGSAAWLRRFAGNKPHAVLPVFSTIGEPGTLLQARLPRVVVFGSPGLREATYQAAGNSLFDWARREVLEIQDIGSAIKDAGLVESLRMNGVVQHGRLADSEISTLMEGARFGLLAYPVDYVAKSSVFAAYCAHGLCPLLLSDHYREVDGLTAGVHFSPGIPIPGSAPDAEAVGRAAWAWYQPHGLARHANTLLALIGQCTGERRC
ncbi:hypothetical protein [Pseudomonas sp. N040]|uniref:hypothetical protein n=1 Tax=Pseudomonas sp. N040 TaxID=2785325 RepID=UPI0018A2C749|nr:hypothetical protein [Pseudomonas sp. N040]MBF7730506.1 hypothetical protein [Pseudomonas sp. N040]MBW7014150.1 hypothetical protein [Pseudomonas sp. N040]